MQVSSLAASRASRRLLIPCRAAVIVGVGAAMLDMGTRVASTTGQWAVGEMRAARTRSDGVAPSFAGSGVQTTSQGDWIEVIWLGR